MYKKKEMMIKGFILGVVLFLGNLIAYGQVYSTKSKKAIKLYKQADQQIRNRQFDLGLETLEKSLRTAPEFNEARMLYAKTYSFLNFDQNADDVAEFHYKKVYALDSNNAQYIEGYLRLLTFSIHKKEFDQAQLYLNTVNKFPGYIVEYQKRLEDTQRLIISAKEAQTNGVSIALNKLDEAINAGPVQFRPFLTADEQTMVFTGKYGNNEDIFQSVKKDGVWTASEEFGNGLNTKNNEGLATISADGKYLVFASTKVEGFGKSDLYYAQKINGNWSKPKNMGKEINTPGFDSEPALSADGRTLYFSSSRKGGHGGKDIWVSKRDENNVWRQPSNLGNIVNTEGNEVTPFIHADHKYLYFASDGHDGLGGFDLYYSARVDSIAFAQPVNLGYPINTEKDEGSLFVNINYSTAYMDVYDYQGRYSTCMIYEFDFPKHLKPEYKNTYAKGIVYDKSSNEQLNTSLSLIDITTGKLLQKVDSDKEDGYLIVLPEGKKCALRAETKGYLFYSGVIEFTDSTLAIVEQDIALSPIGEKGTAVVLENLYFDATKYTLKKTSISELNSLVKLMMLNPTLRLKIKGYTDSVGSKEDNQLLSKNRAKAVVEYLTKKGVSDTRLKAEGFGEENPRATNNTEEGKALNRRIEMEVF